MSRNLFTEEIIAEINPALFFFDMDGQLHNHSIIFNDMYLICHKKYRLIRRFAAILDAQLPDDYAVEIGDDDNIYIRDEYNNTVVDSYGDFTVMDGNVDEIINAIYRAGIDMSIFLKQTCQHCLNHTRLKICRTADELL